MIGHSNAFPKKRRPFIKTSTPLKAIPREWLHEIEPKVYRVEGDDCWYWIGDVTHTGKPTKVTRKGGKLRRVSMINVVAEMFWDIPEGWKPKHTCKTRNCINPEHIIPERK